MKKLLLIIAMSTAGAGHSIAIANANANGTPPNVSGASPAGISPSSTTDTMPVLEIKDSAYQSNPAALRAFEAFRGSYDMEDGSTLNLHRHGRTLYAELSGQPAIRISAAASTRFVATDGRTAIAFRQLPNGLISQVVLTRAVNGRIVSVRGNAADKG